MFPLNGEFFLSEEIDEKEFHLHQPERGLAKLVVRFRFQEVDDFLSFVYFPNTSMFFVI